MSAKGLFVTGIGTDVGKTITSAVLAKALEADYWKPVQCGDLENTDTDKVAAWTSCRTHPEIYRLREPMSPHAAAKAENMQLDLHSIALPDSKRPIVVEGAGGIMVPLNGKGNFLDLMVKLNLPVVLVTRHYLGSINHTMLSWEVLNKAGLNVVALVISGRSHETTEQYFETRMEVPFNRISEMDEVNDATISHEAARLEQQIGRLTD